nr:alpha/beta hydrolase [Rhodopseudomonas rhenobacensis]
MLASQSERAAAPSPTLLSARLGLVECVSSGEGPTVVALHGGMGGVDQSLLLAEAALARPGFRVVALSRPGYLGTKLELGRSPQQQADLIAATLDALDLAQAAVIAVSAGGPSALQFALRHPQRCWGVVLVSCCSGHMATPPEVARRLPLMLLMARLPLLPALLAWQAARQPEKAAARSIADPAVRTRTLAHPQAGPLFRVLLASSMDRLAQRLPGTLNDIAQFAAIDRYPLAQITAPLLVIHGSADRVVPFAHAARVAAEVPRAELMRIEAGEHVCLFTALDAARERLGVFLAAHAPPARATASPAPRHTTAS